MLHGSLWDPEDDVKSNVRSYVDEMSIATQSGYPVNASKVARVLKPGGKWLYITYRQPHFLKPLLAREGVWSLQVETLEDAPGTFEYFGFVISKLKGPSK
jgi:EEF1A lysine methyltransferase 4